MKKGSLDEISNTLNPLTRTQVRTILDNAKNQKLNFSYVLFSTLIKRCGKPDQLDPKVFAKILTDFYRKSNRLIEISEFDGMFSSSSNNIVLYLIHSGHFDLFNEFVLRINNQNPFDDFTTTLRRDISNKVSKHICEEYLGDSQREKALRGFKYFSNSPVTKIDLFKAVFADNFPYNNSDITALLDQPNILNLNLNDEIQAEENNSEKPIRARFSKIIERELFKNANGLFSQLTAPVALSVIASLTQEAWETIFEFSQDSAELSRTLYNILIQLDENTFADFTQKINIDVLSKLSLRHSLNQALYEKFHAIINSSEVYAEFLENLVKEEMKINAALILNNYEAGIVTQPVLLEKIIAYFVREPQSFINILESHFFLALKYFNLMSDDNLKALLLNSNNLNIRLPETLISLFSLCVLWRVKDNTQHTTHLRITIQSMFYRIKNLGVIKGLNHGDDQNQINLIFTNLIIYGNADLLKNVFILTETDCSKNMGAILSQVVLRDTNSLTIENISPKVELALEWLHNSPAHEWISEIFKKYHFIIGVLEKISPKHAVALYSIIKNKYSDDHLTAFYVRMKSNLDANPGLGRDLLERFESNARKALEFTPSAPPPAYAPSAPSSFEMGPPPEYQAPAIEEDPKNKIAELEAENEELKKTLSKLKGKNPFKQAPIQDPSVAEQLAEMRQSIVMLSQTMTATADPAELAAAQQQIYALSVLVCSMDDQINQLVNENQDKDVRIGHLEMVNKDQRIVANLLKFTAAPGAGSLVDKKVVGRRNSFS